MPLSLRGGGFYRRKQRLSKVVLLCSSKHPHTHTGIPHCVSVYPPAHSSELVSRSGSPAQRKEWGQLHGRMTKPPELLAKLSPLATAIPFLSFWSASNFPLQICQGKMIRAFYFPSWCCTFSSPSSWSGRQNLKSVPWT